MKKILVFAASAAMMFASCTKDNNVVGDNGENDGENNVNTNLTVAFNELCGNKVIEMSDGKKYKFIELYNNTDATVDLSGWTIKKYAPDDTYVDGLYFVCWTAPQNTTINAGGYLQLVSDQTDPAVGFNAGLSAKKEVKFELIDATGKVVDKFVRGKELADGNIAENELTENTDASFSRVPNGNGNWAYAVPTPNAANGTKTGDIEQK